MSQLTSIQIEAIANAPVAKVWEAWNNPNDIIQWNSASPDWHCPYSENDLKVGGKFKHRMEAKDGSYGFDFEGKYDEVDLHRNISYSLSDGRRVSTLFKEQGDSTHVITTFDAETENDPELQKQRWQAILNNFVNYLESKN